MALRVARNSAMRPLEMAGMSGEMAAGKLSYKHSVLASDDVSSFFHSLDDNCVWHLYHFDQVMPLIPGVRMSRAKFRGRRPGQRSKRETLLGRFPKDEHLLMLLDGTVTGAGDRLQANDACARNRMDMARVSEVVKDHERCIQLAVNPDGGKHVVAAFERKSDDHVLPVYECNYTAVSSDLQAALDISKGCAGYAVCLDIDIDDDAQGDQFIITGGTGKALTSTIVDDEGRAVTTAIAGVEAAYLPKSIRSHSVREWRCNGRVVWSLSRFSGRFCDFDELVDLGPRKTEAAGGMRPPDMLLGAISSKTVSCARPGCKSKLLSSAHDHYCGSACARRDAGAKSLWCKGRPWFGVRYGQPYVLTMSGLDLYASSERGRKARLVVEQTMGTIHELPQAVDGAVEVHFFDVYDYLNALDRLRKASFRFSERKQGITLPSSGVGGERGDGDGFSEDVGLADDEDVDLDLRSDGESDEGGPARRRQANVFSVWVHCKQIVDPSAYPSSGTRDVFWNAAFDIPEEFDADLRGAWHSVAVSVSPTDGGVTAYLDGEVENLPASMSGCLSR